MGMPVRRQLRSSWWSSIRVGTLATIAVTGSSFGQELSAPLTRADLVKETLHGVELVDPYRWLEDQESHETRQWIEEQNRYAEAMLGKLPGRDAIRARLTELMRVDSVSMPTEKNGRYFFSRKLADQELSVVCMRQGLLGKDEVLIDPHPMSTDHTTSVQMMAVSEDGKLLVYGIRSGGEDEVTIQIREVQSRRDLPDRMPRARYSGIALLHDNSGFYYALYDSKVGPRAYFHALGDDPARDRLIFGEGYGPGVSIGTSLSENGRHLLYYVAYGSAALKTELYHQDLVKKGPIHPIVNDVEATFFGRFAEDALYVRTNWEAPNGRIVRIDPNQPSRDQWKEIVPTTSSVLTGFSLAGGRLFAQYLENVLPRVKILDSEGKALGEITFPTLGSVSGVSGDWDKNEAFLSFSSYHIPQTIFRYDVADNERSEWWRSRVPVRGEDIEVKQVWYESRDKTRVPMFVVHPKKMPLDGDRPTFLTGYGGFNSSMTPGFNPAAVQWVEQGGVYAVPNLRGGGEFGENWHKAGMLDKKQNVFDDFIAAAEWLIASKYTSPRKLAISGGSNGGLLVGAALTQRPDLFQAVVCSVPLLDMVRYDKFLVAKFWVPEYGSADDPGQFEFLRKYSPYQNVKKGTSYPAVLFITGDSDTRVAPLHARKMCALLQASTSSKRPVVLQYDTKSGHSGGKPVRKIIDDRTDELSFLFWQLGCVPEPPAQE